jgi:TRAP-type C4-dicarboxylate transport system permease small subunit
MKDTLERWLGTLFGLVFLALACVVTVETLSRKVFNFSIQGADELGGYSLAVGATIAFTLALLGRSHIRVDVFHERLPAWLKSALNWLSVVGLAALAVLMAWLARAMLADSMQYQSVSQTPWATPLKVPQAAWFAGLAIFALAALAAALRATWLLVSGRRAELDREFGPRSTRDEVDEELEDLKARSGDAPAPAALAEGARA